MKYPGAFILNEYGTNKELSKAYGVSERTIYRWKSKAKAETGARARKAPRPRPSTLQKFKGTRKELAKKYGVSERTVYRWLNKAKEKGYEIESRQKKKENLFGKMPKTDSFGDFIDEFNKGIFAPKEPKPEEPANDFYNEIFEVPEFEEPTPASDEELEDIWEVPEPIKYSDTVTEQLNDIGNMLSEFDLLNEGSKFFELSDEMKNIYLNEYIQYQWDLNRYQFNQSPPDDPNGPDISDPEKIANIDIWGDEFETWLTNKMEVDLL